MKLTFKPYDKINELRNLEEDVNRIFKKNMNKLESWKSYTKKYKYIEYFRVFAEDEFAGLVCWAINDRFVWDDEGVYFDVSNNKAKDYSNVIENISWLYSIGLEDKFRNKGLSHQLMQKYETESKKNGASWLGLHVLADNDARFLYKSENFKVVFKNKWSIWMIKKLD